MIRAVRPSDAAAINAIYNPYIAETTVTFETEPLTEEQMRERISRISAAFPYLVHESDGCVDGYAYADPFHPRAAYAGTVDLAIYLAPGAQGRSIGKHLMERLIEECKERGFRNMIAAIVGENRQSIRFHESMGFRKVAHMEGVGKKFGRLLDVLYYQLKL